MRCAAQRSGSRKAGRPSRLVSAVVLGFGLVLFASTSQALDADHEEIEAEETLPSYAGTQLHDDYDPKQAAHPLRIVAYGLHPIGVALDWLIVRPAFWVVRHEPFSTIFGYED